MDTRPRTLQLSTPASPALRPGAPRSPALRSRTPEAAAFFDVEGTLLAVPALDPDGNGPPLGRLWHAPVLAALHDHAARGHLLVLVTPSPAGAVAPLAGHLGVDTVLCSRPGAPMRGQGKGYAARALLRERAILAARCYAYADEAADLPLLAEVGNPVVVGDDPVLLRHARRGNWARLPAPVPREM
ncbi:haloacid dehalogenase-like hydrolase [Streptomyces sp. NPDC020719]|uniref:HAD family hydrolase n=1 Tax=Streptomyces sp. NPDC020719 TaxID=3154896 RepID=UPI003408212A